MNLKDIFDKEINVILSDVSNIPLDNLELFLLIFNVKPVCFTDVLKKDKPIVENFAKKYDFYFLFVDPGDINIKGPNTSNESEYLIIGRKKEDVLRYREVYFGRSDMEKFIEVGTLLGYPGCCSQKYINFRALCIEKDEEFIVRDYYYKIAEKSENYNLLINSFFCFYGRANGSDIWKTGKIMGDVDLFLISHIPCSFDCKESISYAQKVHEVVKLVRGEESAKKTIKILSNPILFFNVFDFIALNGKAEKNSIKYTSIASPQSLVDSSILEKVEMGNVIMVDDKTITILKDDKKIEVIKKNCKEDGFVIPFQGVIS